MNKIKIVALAAATAVATATAGLSGIAATMVGMG